jgi:NADH-quinone oxidoreductase subunit H
MQAGLFTNWLVFHDPFTFAVFWVYFTCGVASVNRAPFDLAEAESELVAGFHTEYSGLRWSFFFMAEYGSMFTVAALAAILFFGGWNGPIPVLDAIGLSTTSNGFLYFLGNLLGCVNFLLKTVVGVIVMMWVRWTLPRLRIDQVMETCLKYCVPIAAVCFLGAVTWQVYGLPSLGEITGTRVEPYRVRESWVLRDLPRTAEPATPPPASTSPAGHVSANSGSATPTTPVTAVAAAAIVSATEELVP